MPDDSPLQHLLDSLCGINEVAELLDVTPNQVREFRGSLGQIDKGIFITTSRFTKLAIEEGQDPTKGKTIDLIDGDRLCELLREYKIGIKEKNDVNIDKDFFENI